MDLKIYLCEVDKYKSKYQPFFFCILSPCLFSSHAEYIMWNTGLNEAQAGIKISGRNINNLRYTDYTTFKAENEEELKNLDESERGE